MSSNLVKGTFILTFGLFLSKGLGLLYVIPFYAIVGQKNIGLYQYAYIPYNLALAVAISGAPLAISKFVSKHNANGDYATGRKLMNSGLIVMLVSGVMSFLLLFFMAEPVAHRIRRSDEQNFTIEEITSVIRCVSYALLVVPIMSLIRGYFQGNQKFEPTSVSQLIEQIVRILTVLIGAFIIVNVLGLSPRIAVNFAVFAAFIGALAGLVVLFRYWVKYKAEFTQLYERSPTASDVNFFSMYKEVIGYTIPFVLVGVINPLYQFVDLLTFSSAMDLIGKGDLTDDYFTMFNFLTHKIVMIPVLVATGFSMALIPVITKLYAENNHNEITNSLDKTYQILLFLTVPMVLGLMVLSNEVYRFLYEKSTVGAEILATYAPVAILFGLYTVTAAILQGIDKHKWIIFTSLTGLSVKLVVNIPLIKLFEVNGAIIATAIGYATAVGINIFIISKALRYRSQLLCRRLILIGIFNIIMSVAVYFTLHGLLAIHSGGRVHAFLYVLICMIVGLVVYGYLSLKTGLAKKLFGDQLTQITKKLGLGG